MSAVPVFSSRLLWSAPLNPITELLARKREANERIFDLTESNPTHAGIDYPAGEISRALSAGQVLRYDPDPFGNGEARDGVASYYGGRVETERIILTASTSEAYAYLFKLLADPDHATQARLIRRYIAWRNRNTDNPRLRALVNAANVA